MDFNGPREGNRHTLLPASGLARKGRSAATGIARLWRTPPFSRFGPVPNPGGDDCSAEGAGDS
ncbi:hypothetical protein [Planotetraspora kaengkrachanensis]|uniref:Uncharacterized protein n=1 Tax=Planotetraspora kaengkrachanensis TaxID=575193 RepID=A0A8J3M2P5_9ACTN|nr:hypothetical protein [Planotetraspora kaengkrachanensis]GIG77931.1 hypothetical protein Pka01_10580 [Planotetraspora kaengkrachanensis]